MTGAVTGWLDRHDPDRSALIKAVKVSVVVTAGLAIGTVIGNSQLTLFAAFGGVALMLFTEFPGSRSARLGAYLVLSAVGCVLITLGTLVSRPLWVAVAAMAVVGFVVLFAGVLSAASAAAVRAALLTFVLPVTIPATVADVPSRLAGWLIATVLAVPIAILVWPPKEHDELRRRAGAACAALAAELSAVLPPASSASLTDRRAETDDAMAAYSKAFRSTTFRPVSLTTGSRLLMQLTDRLEWLRSVAKRLPPDGTDGSPEGSQRVVSLCVEILQASAQTLAASVQGNRQPPRRLDDALAAGARERATQGEFLQVVRASEPGGGAFRPAVLHELLYTTRLSGQSVSLSARADARSLADRLLGRNVPRDLPGSVAIAAVLVAGHTTRRSVWFQNSLRGALGLAIAVAIAAFTGIAHGFWVVLGTMSVLRTTALTTGSTAVRAIAGTTVGFILGAGLIWLFGVTPWHLWLLLPVLLLVAGFVPTAISFTAGQVAFTGLVVILFNIIQPTGWSVGLVRVEDVALGCAAGLISGILLWPRGAAGQIRTALADHYRQAGASLANAVRAMAVRPEPGAVDLAQSVADAKASAFRLDDALREYLAERGSRALPLDVLTSLSNGANRIRLAAEAVAELATERAPASAPTTGTAGTAATPEREEAVRAAGESLTSTANDVERWIALLAEALAKTGRARPDPPVSSSVDAEQAVLQALRHCSWELDGYLLWSARSLWASSLYVDDIAAMEPRVSSRAAMLG